TSGTNVGSSLANRNGGPGTIYIEGPQHVDGQGDLYIIDNGVFTAFPTTIHEQGTTFAQLTTGNDAHVVYDSSSLLTLGGISVDSDSVLKLRSVVVNGDVEILNGGTLGHPSTTSAE